MDERIAHITQKINKGEITRFGQIYEEIPLRILAQYIGNSGQGRFMYNVQRDPYLFRVGEVFKIASLFKISEAKVLALMKPDIEAAEDGRRFYDKGRPLSKELPKNAKKAQSLMGSGKYTKLEVCEKMKISRPTLDKYLKLDLSK